MQIFHVGPGFSPDVWAEARTHMQIAEGRQHVASTNFEYLVAALAAIEKITPGF
jgi:hypothetical protein